MTQDPEKNASPYSKEEQMKSLNSPCALPNAVDGSLEAWLFRLTLWGKTKITHKNPDYDTVRVLTDDQFLNYMDDKVQNETYGEWKTEEVKLDKIRFHRTYWSIHGKNVTEEIIVDIDLKPELKARVDAVRRKDSWIGKLGF